VVVAGQALGVGAVQDREDHRLVEPAGRVLGELRVDGQARGQGVAGRLGDRPQPVKGRPGPLRVDVVGRDRTDAAPVVDPGPQQDAEVLGQVGWRLQVDGLVQQHPGRGDGPQVLVEVQGRARRHGRARLGPEVLDDDLLDVPVAAVGLVDGGQGLQPLGPRLADAAQDPGGERDGQLTGRLQGGQAGGRHLGDAAGMGAARLVQPLGQRLQHHPLARRARAQAGELLPAEGAGVGVGQQPGLRHHQPAHRGQVLDRAGVAQLGQGLAGLGPALLRPLAQGEQGLVAAGGRPGPGDLQDLVGGQIGTPFEPGRRLDEGAVAAVVTAQPGERDEDLGRVGDAGAERRRPDAAGLGQQLVERGGLGDSHAHDLPVLT
jgi:hypothetical protein